MSNRLLTMKEVTDSLLEGFNDICDKEGIPEKDRPQLIARALGGLFDGPMRPEDFQP